MQILSQQNYEAIASYDHSLKLEYKAALIIEPSHCVVALCFYNDKGNCEIKNIWSNDTDLLCFENEIKDVIDFSLYETAIKNAVRTFYLSNKCSDVVISGTDKKASELMSLFSDRVGNKLNVYFESVDMILAESGIKQHEVRILLVGNLAKFFPAEAMARLHYSTAMPMLPDSRYGNYDNLSDIIEKGQEIIRQKRTKVIDGAVEWVVVYDDGTGNIQKRNLTIAEDGKKLEELTVPEFTSKVFVCAEDDLEISIAGSIQKISVPDRLLTDNLGMIRLGLQFDKGEFSLIIDANGEFESYPVNVRIKGE